MALVLVFGVFLLIVSGIPSSVGQANETLQYRYVCPKNFENVGRKCYHFSNGTATWFQAYFSCKDLDEGNFTVFTSRYDQRQLEHFLFRNSNRNPDAPYLNSFWVGGFKDWKQKKWIYIDGALMQFPTLKEIHLSQRDSWTCLLIDGNTRRWKAENCMEKRQFICESNATASVELKVVNKKVKRKITIDECISNSEFLTKKQKKKCLKMLNGRNGNGEAFNEHVAVIQPAYPTQPTVIRAITHICPQAWMSLGNQCYLFSKERVTWSEAHFNCGQINSKLAIVRSKVQDQKLRIFLNGFTEKQERWIGGRYNGKTREWIWALNGKPLKYKGFAISNKEPSQLLSNNSDNNLDWQAIVMDPQHGYKWTHRNEMEKHFYICQVKGRAVKRLNYPRRPSATIEIVPDRRYQRRNHQQQQQQQDNRLWNRPNRRANRNKRT